MGAAALFAFLRVFVRPVPQLRASEILTRQENGAWARDGQDGDGDEDVSFDQGDGSDRWSLGRVDGGDNASLLSKLWTRVLFRFRGVAGASNGGDHHAGRSNEAEMTPLDGTSQ